MHRSATAVLVPGVAMTFEMQFNLELPSDGNSCNEVPLRRKDS